MDKTTDNTSPFKGVEGSQTPPLRRTGGLWQTADSLEYILLKENAKNNRHNQTEAESVFWQIARCNGLGEKCRRQYVIGDFIVDFIFRKSMLIIELDGGYHNEIEQQQADALRQDWLEHQGYKVIRFTNEQVLFDTDKVIKTIKQHLQFPL